MSGLLSAAAINQSQMDLYSEYENEMIKDFVSIIYLLQIMCRVVRNSPSVLHPVIQNNIAIQNNKFADLIQYFDPFS